MLKLRRLGELTPSLTELLKYLHGKFQVKRWPYCALFADGQDNHLYLTCLWEAAERYGLAVHAYVLMTNLVHLLVSPEQPTCISHTLQSVGRRYARYFNFIYGRTGT